MFAEGQEDTIAAIATPPGEGGVGIVRISGPRAREIGDAVFRPAGGGEPLSRRPHGTVTYGRAVEADGREIDTVLALVMRAPRSYTGEDVVELQGHGGRVVLRRLLRRVIEAGARPAEPGEFTRRAFLNGKLDLVQAEAVCDLVRARSDRAAEAALEQLEGRLSRSFNRLYDLLLETAADLETTLDFAEEELPDDVFSGLKGRLDEALGLLRDLLATWDEGRLLREGARAVILGRPNAGKSTLLNALLGFDRAIVSAVPGTTRDTIEEDFVLDGIPLRIVDTAGLRRTACEIEAEGIRRAEDHGRKADLALYVVDASEPPAAEDRERLAGLDAARTLVVLNKTDLGRRTTADDFPGFRCVELQALSGEGLDRLKAAMAELLEQGPGWGAEPHAAISERHRLLLVEAEKEALSARKLVAADAEANAAQAVEHLRTALEAVGRTVGRVYHEELLESIFSRFCIGK